MYLIIHTFSQNEETGQMRHERTEERATKGQEESFVCHTRPLLHISPTQLYLKQKFSKAQDTVTSKTMSVKFKDSTLEPFHEKHLRLLLLIHQGF